eukprot:TRINITY_DN3269_c0_g1_i1.p1 TRINITY_DN3269_c0_g1~~TRINITY_DN3269_c0_g1_i1.p1  ORF type:complete len:343 (+),score=57.05 TRINITY_DN3269_c0_g1_i1:606-1634(+)
MLRFTYVLRHSATSLKFTSNRDACTKVIGDGGWVRFSFIQALNTCLEGIKRHEVTPGSNECEDLCKLYMMTMLLASFQGGEERVKIDTCNIATNCSYTVEATATGEVRGHLRVADPDSPKVTCISRTLYNNTKPVVSITPAPHDDIIENLKDHNELSDGNLDLALWFHVDLKKDICVGALAQRIPTKATADNKVTDGKEDGSLPFKEMENRLNAIKSDEFNPGGDIANIAVPMQSLFSGNLTPLMSSLKLIPKMYKGPQIMGNGNLSIHESAEVQRIPVDFYCRCSLAGFVEGLALIGETELTSLRFSQPECPLKCQQCGKVHKMTPEAWSQALSLAGSAKA